MADEPEREEVIVKLAQATTAILVLSAEIRASVDAINSALTSLITYERRLEDDGEPVPPHISEAIATLRSVVP